MSRLVVAERVTLDGVFDADSMDQWFFPFESDERGAYIQDVLLASDVMLYGRTTYEMLAPFWSAMKNNEMGVADKLNNVRKYVVSSTMKQAEWNNSTIIKENVSENIAKLKQEPGGEILVQGSATLVKSLMDADLVDEFRFLVHPVIMGNGKRFFNDGTDTTKLQLVRTQTLPLGVVALHYETSKSK